MGLYVVQEVVPVDRVPRHRWHENVHVRKVKRGETDIVVRAKPDGSGRFDRCIPIGEWRSRGVPRSSRHTRCVGWIVGEGRLHPCTRVLCSSFANPVGSLPWFQKQGIRLTRRNN